MKSIKLDIVSAPDGTVRFQLPEAGGVRVHIEACWEPVERVERDRKEVFAEARRRGRPDVLALIEKLGEDAILNPEILLLWGCIDDPTFVEPPDPPPQERDPID